MSFLRFSALLGIAATAAVVVAGSAAASGVGPRASGVVGHVYVNDNSAPVSTVAGFDRYADGSLSSMPGSPLWSAAREGGIRTRRRARWS